MRGVVTKKRLVISASIAALVGFATLFSLAWQIVYPPRMAPVKPQGFRLERMPSAQGFLSIYLSPNLADGKPSPVVYLLAHGRNESRADHSTLMEMMAKRGMDCASVPMPGQDESPESQVSFGARGSDVLIRTLDYLEEKVGKDRLNVALIGFDTGASTVWATARRDSRIRGVVSVNGFSNLAEALPAMSRIEGRTVPRPVGRAVAGLVALLSSESIERISPVQDAMNFSRPAMVVHGALETGYGTDDAEALATASRADLWIVKGGAESAAKLVGRDTFVKHLEGFTQRVLDDVRDQTLYRKLSRYKPKRLTGDTSRIAMTEDLPRRASKKRRAGYQRLGWLGL